MNARKGDPEVPGNTLATAALVEREMSKVGGVVYRFSHQAELSVREGVCIRSLKLKAPSDGWGEWLAILTVQQGDQALVAFHRGSTMVECLVGLCQRYQNGSLKWKEDSYG